MLIHQTDYLSELHYVNAPIIYLDCGNNNGVRSSVMSWLHHKIRKTNRIKTAPLVTQSQKSYTLSELLLISYICSSNVILLFDIKIAVVNNQVTLSHMLTWWTQKKIFIKKLTCQCRMFTGSFISSQIRVGETNPFHTTLGIPGRPPEANRMV